MGQVLTYFRRKTTEAISFEDLADILHQSNLAVALTGAGVSAESGIPTFRDPHDGLWQKYDPSVYATIWGFWRHPEKIWELIRDFLLVHDPQPNAGHVALARLEQLGCLQAIITQNVDNLHQDAGSTKVVEFHGNLLTARCYKCGATYPVNKELIKSSDFAKSLPPKCTLCGGNVKPDCILFGESIPSTALREASQLVKNCDVLLVIGTSATVSPASELPYTAMNHGATVIEINMESTGLTNRISDKIIFGKSSELEKTVRHLEG
eukprot:GHVS01040040.1.p1 GENE.GHVS01040040.1~~GHVS01040040.1.p1  ORF type:complete len:265 (+),score=10.37 GHVS01040040.1:321-1115(+)